ncbi:MAG: membrane or secreted protein [Flavobacteriaceae bacterium]
MELFFITLVLLAVAFAGIAIKGGEFAGTCASQSPFLNKEGEPCSLCGKLPSQQTDCDLPKPEHNS